MWDGNWLSSLSLPATSTNGVRVHFQNTVLMRHTDVAGNPDGHIRNETELFGSSTELANALLAADGFKALAGLARPGPRRCERRG